MAGVRTFEIRLRLGSGTSVVSGPINRLSHLGGRILSLRERKGWTQGELADRTGLHYVTLGRIEKGRANVTILTLSKIADALDVAFTNLLELDKGVIAVAHDSKRDTGDGSILKHLGRRISYLRERRGWSQKELAKRTGLHHVTVSRIEKGQRNITLLDTLKIAEVLEVEVGELLRSNPHELK